MNFSQFYGILRIVLPSAAAFAIGKGWISQDTYTQVGGALAAIVAAGGFSAVANTDGNLVKTASAVQGVAEPIRIAADAPAALQALANDTNVPGVQPASPYTAPTYPSATQRR